MSPDQQKWVKDLVALMGRQNIDRLAEIHALTDALADVMSQIQSRDRSLVLSELRRKLNETKEKYLLEIENVNPGLAAAMDEDLT